jgi:hypothetical protein
MTICTCLRGMTKNPSFLCFGSIFMSYCPQFWISAVIYKAHDTQSMSERHDQKLVVFTFSGRFHELLSTILGFRGDFQGPWHLVHVWHAWPKTHFFAFMSIFVSYCPLFWGSRAIYKEYNNLYMFEMYDQKLIILTF